jgi:hypothetical protein
MPTQAEIAANMVAALSLTEPTLDTTIGSIARKIIDAVAGGIAEHANDSHLITYAYDIDSKAGGDLDDFVALFGMARLQGQRATGTVTFSRTQATANAAEGRVPLGAQVVTSSDPTVYVQVMANTLLSKGQPAGDAPVQALNYGPDGNVAAGTLTQIASQLTAVTRAYNAQALIGGATSETDAHLRARFKSTVFRNIAGTQHMYRALALQTTADPTDTNSRAVTNVNVIGPRLTWREQGQIANGSFTSQIHDAAYIYPQSVFLQAIPDPDDPAPEADTPLLTPGAHYTVTINNSPVYPASATLIVNSVNSGLTEGGVYNLRFDYVSKYSRNDPFGTRWGSPYAYISNRIDLWCNGMIVKTATQSGIFSNTSTWKFNSVHNDPLCTDRFATAAGVAPKAGDVFQPLLHGPPLQLDPGTLPNYTAGVDYDLIYQMDAFGMTPTSSFGLIWYTPSNYAGQSPADPRAAAKTPANGTALTIVYTYNYVPQQVQSTVEGQWRLLGTDLQVHAGLAKLYRFYLYLVYTVGSNPATVNDTIDLALVDLVNNLGFDSALQVSDVLQTVHNVAGVDNVRFVTLNDPENGSGYGIQQMYPNPDPDQTSLPGPIIQTGGRAKDIYFDDASYPVFDSAVKYVKARNTFGTS